jgi:hypothetical protein
MECYSSLTEIGENVLKIKVNSFLKSMDQHQLVIISETKVPQEKRKRRVCAYNIFVKQAMLSVEYAHIPPKERMSIISKKWKDFKDKDVQVE